MLCCNKCWGHTLFDGLLSPTNSIIAALLGVIGLLIRRLIATPELRAQGKTETLVVLTQQIADLRQQRLEDRVYYDGQLNIVRVQHNECEKRYDRLFEEVVLLRTKLGGHMAVSGSDDSDVKH